MQSSSHDVNQDLLVRINGVLPDITGGTNTSISVFSQGSHLLVDTGNGVAASLKKSAAELGYKEAPDIILITSARKEHIAELASLLGSAKAYCTSECLEQLMAMPHLADRRSSFTTISPGQAFSASSFSVTPVAANNAGDEPGSAGSVIYVIESGGRKVIAGWDFVTLPGIDEKLMWKPDLLILGTETYNEHPSTGMISVSEAYSLVRRWNAKDCYILHYSGEKDREDATNQWHRGPAGPLSPEDLQKAVDSHLLVSGQEGKFSIKVAREGMTWTPTQEVEDEGPIGTKIEVEALEKYIFSLEKMTGGRLVVAVEDAINRLTSEFVNAKRTAENSLHASPEKSGFFKGPELNVTVSGENVRLEIIKGKKPIFANDLPVSAKDAKRLTRFIQENF
jgi:L-ascorbate metabolism protein UlaG (beta-lactamase superfamily)